MSEGEKIWDAFCEFVRFGCQFTYFITLLPFMIIFFALEVWSEIRQERRREDEHRI